RGKAIKKTVCVSTDSHILAEEPPHESFPIREWTIQVLGKDEDIQQYVSKVEFKLHESFPDPNRVVEKAPFAITEKGWGEFVMDIVLHFVDNSAPPVSFKHELHFNPEKYTKFPVLNIKPNSFEIAQSVFGETLESPSVDATMAVTPSSKKRKRLEVPSVFNDEDMESLKKKLEGLQAGDILEVVDGVAQVDETSEELKFDLYTLSHEELAKLWTFCLSKNKK
ncbi:yeats-domain-containing protein, partial [Rozella allomycis CSF55]